MSILKEKYTFFCLLNIRKYSLDVYFLRILKSEVNTWASNNFSKLKVKVSLSFEVNKTSQCQSTNSSNLGQLKLGHGNCC